MPKLLLSYTATLQRLHRGTLTPEDLSDALFYFGCVREHALAPAIQSTDSEGARRTPEQQILHKAIYKAEDENRVAWRKLHDWNTFDQLNELLQGKGFAPLDFAQYDQPYYNYPTVEQAVRDQNLPLEVIWRG